MPLYDYECSDCRQRFEVIHGVHADGPTSCPLCGGGPVRKAMVAPAIHFKGSGWAKKERRATVTPGAKGTDGSADGGDGGGGGREGADGKGDGTAPSTGPSSTGDAWEKAAATAKTAAGSSPTGSTGD